MEIERSVEVLSELERILTQDVAKVGGPDVLLLARRPSSYNAVVSHGRTDTVSASPATRFA
ncbi:hypothetical protein GCM10022236_42630 [Microlunatus ginsengisoli]|uniref:Uncharacterized protein n=1 Tax=Microlunatus ginsengisoli TaxID=363863 RepID=A0ABP7ALD0_9ACTN